MATSNAETVGEKAITVEHYSLLTAHLGIKQTFARFVVSFIDLQFFNPQSVQLRVSFVAGKTCSKSVFLAGRLRLPLSNG